MRKLTGKKSITEAVVLLCLGMLLLFGMSGCGKSRMDEAQSPRLQDLSIETYNEGSEATQFVAVTLQFDQAVALGKDSLKNMRIKIAEERMEDCSVTHPSDKEVLLTIPVTAITKGNLTITEEKDNQGFSGITDAAGTYAVWTFSVDALIPSGITLTDRKAENKNGFAKEVSGIWNIRNITWVKLTENQEAVADELDASGEQLDGAIAVHGHEFLMSDTTMITTDIVEALNKHYGKHYIFKQDGTTITGSRIDGSYEAKLDLEIYTYKKIQSVTQK